MEHSFDVEIAREYGIPAAILLKQMDLWIKANKRKGKNEFDGKTWTYNSSTAIADYIPYLSAQTIKRTLAQMVAAGLLERGNFNKVLRDRTAWYTLTDKALELISHCSKMTHAKYKNEPCTGQKCTVDGSNLNHARVKNDPPLPSKYTSKLTSISPPIVPPTGDSPQPKEPEGKDKPDYTATRKEILDYLNAKAGTKYRDGAEAKKHINARLNENYTLDDFKTVIDSKCGEWLNDPKMRSYLRPQTLFGPKFDGYLGAAGMKGNAKEGVGIAVDHERLLDSELEEIFGRN